MIVIFFLVVSPAFLWSSTAITPATSPGYDFSCQPSPDGLDGGTMKMLTLMPSLALGPASALQFDEDDVQVQTPVFDSNAASFPNPYQNLFNKNPSYMLVSQIEENVHISRELNHLKNFQNDTFEDTSDLLLAYIDENLKGTPLELISLILHERIYEKHTYDIQECIQNLIVLAKLNLDINPTFFLFFHEQLDYLIQNEPNRSRKVHEFYADFSYIIRLMSFDKISYLCGCILSDDVIKYLFDCFVAEEMPLVMQLKKENFHDTFKNLSDAKKTLKDQPSLLLRMLLAHQMNNSIQN